MLHSAILSTFIKLPFVIKIFVLSFFEWPFYTGFTVFASTFKIKKGRFPYWHYLLILFVCLIRFFTSHQQSFSYMGAGLPGLNQCLARTNLSCSRTQRSDADDSRGDHLLIIITLLNPMDFSIKLHTIKSEWSIVYIEGLPVIISKDYYFLSLKIDSVLEQTVQTMTKCRVMRQFVWVFTVCNSTRLGVSSPQRIYLFTCTVRSDFSCSHCLSSVDIIVTIS